MRSGRRRRTMLTLTVLLALDVEQEAVFERPSPPAWSKAGQEMSRIRRGGSCRLLAVLDELLDLIEAVVDQLRVLRHLLDVAQRDPDAGALDVADRLRRRALSDLDIPVPGVGDRQVALLATARNPGWSRSASCTTASVVKSSPSTRSWCTAMDRRANASANAVASVSTTRVVLERVPPRARVTPTSGEGSTHPIMRVQRSPDPVTLGNRVAAGPPRPSGLPGEPGADGSRATPEGHTGPSHIARFGLRKWTRPCPASGLVVRAGAMWLVSPSSAIRRASTRAIRPRHGRRPRLSRWSVPRSSATCTAARR